MRYVYPLLTLLAFLLFVGSTLCAVALLVLFPFLVLGLVALLVFGRQIVAAFRSLALIPQAFSVCFRAAGLLLGIVFNPLLEREAQLPERGYARSDMPELFALVDDVAAAMRTRSIDRAFLVPEANAAVFEHGGFLFLFGAKRYLIIGLPLAYGLGEDELRAVLAHELGHFARLHTTLSRVVGRFLRSLLNLYSRIGSALNPLYWSTALSVAVMESIYFPWKRLKEFDVDRDSAAVIGANHAISALRKSRDNLPALELATEMIIASPVSAELAPTHLGEAAARLAGRIAPQARHRLAVRSQGDVLQFEEETHPPTPQRIAALAGLPPKEGRGAPVAIQALPDVKRLERDLTRQIFRTGPTYLEPTQFVPAFLSRLAEPPPAPVQQAARGALSAIEYCGGNTIGFEPEPAPDPVQALREAIEAKDADRTLTAYSSVPPEAHTPAELHLEAGKVAITCGKYPLALQALRAAANGAADEALAATALVLAARVYAERLGDAAAAQRLYAYVVQRYPTSRAASFANEKLRGSVTG